MNGCKFQYQGKYAFVPFDDALVHAIKTREISGPRNPHKMRLLGLIGECLVPPLLEHHGFSNVITLNSIRMNYPDADLLADRNGERFFISVKARNKFQNNGTLNSRYKLESRGRRIRHALKAAQEHKAQFAWITVQIDEKSYCAYFGTHADICGLGSRKPVATGVLMSDRWTQSYKELAGNEGHDLPSAFFSNQTKVL